MIKTGPHMIRGKKAVPSFIIFALPTFIIYHSQRPSNINCLTKLPPQEKVTEVIRKHMKVQVNKEQPDKQIQLAVIYLQIWKNVFDEPTQSHLLFSLIIFISTSGLLMSSDT